MTVRAILLLKKLDTFTDEEFTNYMKGPHSDAIMKVSYLKEKNITFSSFGIDKAAASSTGFSVAEFDGEFNFWCFSIEDFIGMFKDPEWLQHVVPDGAKFNKQAEGRLMIGYDSDLLPNKEAP